MIEAEHISSRRTLLGVVLFVLIVSLAQYIVTRIMLADLEQNTDRIEQIEKVNRQDAIQQISTLRKVDANAAESIRLERAAEYRQCLRGMVTRSVITIHERQDHRNNKPPLQIYDCTPNLVGQAPVVLLGRDKEAFINQVKLGAGP